MTTKEALHRLVDELPEQELSTAKQILAGLRDGTVDSLALKLITAPYDDEEGTEAERQAVQEARDALARGELLSDEDLRRELGI